MLDVTDAASVLAAVAAHQPSTIIHCAAWTAVDACEADPERAQLVNGTAVEHVVAAAEEHGANVIQISTDYVFDGTKEGSYVEDDEPNPRSVYGASKRAGELAAADHTVVRVSWVAGEQGRNIIKTIVRLSAEHEELSFADDRVGHPSFTSDLAPALLDLSGHGPQGIVHLTNQGEATWYDVAREVLSLTGHDPERVKPVPSSVLNQAAERPVNSRLDNVRWKQGTFGPMLRDWRAPLADLLARIAP